MGPIMRRLLAIAGATLALAGSPAAADPTGLWRVANGEANIRIDDCGGALWGITAWEKKTGNLDSQNPNPALRSRPTLGIHILMGMRPTKPNLWQGEVYDAENGKTYDSRLSVVSPDVLHIAGCVLGGLICGGEDWTRLPQPATRAPPSRSACSGIPDGAGTAHKGGLK
jgi:uncharacterized protein (DUF2147 family)